MRAIPFLLLAGLLSAQTPPAKSPAKPAAKTPAKTAAKSAPAAAPPARLLNPSALVGRAPDDLKVKFTTTKGDFVIEAHRAWAPIGTDRFYNLVRAGFYKDVAFFRVIPGFMAQFGMSPYPAVTRVWEKATIKDDPVKQSNKRGYVTFAKTGAPNSRTTQLFINFSDRNSMLDSDGFAPFGQVVEGMDVVDKIYSGYGEGADSGGKGPTQDAITRQGKPYLDKNFPLMDRILSTEIISPEGGTAAPAAAPKAAPKAPAPPAPKK